MPTENDRDFREPSPPPCRDNGAGLLDRLLPGLGEDVRSREWRKLELRVLRGCGSNVGIPAKLFKSESQVRCI